MAPMKTLKNISFKNRLALSYSFILALMLISAAIFYHTSYHHLKKRAPFPDSQRTLILCPSDG